MEREAVEDYVESVMSGVDPTTVEDLLRAANELATLRSNFSSGIVEDALSSEA